MRTALSIRGGAITGYLCGKTLLCNFYPVPPWSMPAPGEYYLQAPVRDLIFGVVALMIPTSLLVGRAGGGVAMLPKSIPAVKGEGKVATSPKLAIGGLTGSEFPIGHVAEWDHHYEFHSGKWESTSYNFSYHPERSEHISPGTWARSRPSHSPIPTAPGGGAVRKCELYPRGSQARGDTVFGLSDSVADKASAPRHSSVFVLSSRPIPNRNSLVVTFGFSDLVAALSTAGGAGVTIRSE